MSRQTGFIKKHSTEIISRHLQRRDEIGEFIISPKCVTCGSSIHRNRFRDGTLEHRTVWLKRKCCPNLGENKKVPSKCLIAYRIKFLTKPEKWHFCRFCKVRLSRRTHEYWLKNEDICMKCIKLNGTWKDIKQNPTHIFKRINATCNTRYNHTYNVCS